jgi:hypothetical protein
MSSRKRCTSSTDVGIVKAMLTSPTWHRKESTAAILAVSLDWLICPDKVFGSGALLNAPNLCKRTRTILGEGNAVELARAGPSR